MFRSALAGFFLLASLPCLAADDRDNSSKTTWSWTYGKTKAQIDTLAAASNLRIVDVKVENPGSGTKTFTVAFVSNTGVYTKTWTWFADMTVADLFTYANDHNVRPVVLDAYQYAPGDERVAVVFVSNTGPDAKVWWLYTGVTAAGVGDALSTNTGRLIQVRRYTIDGLSRYAVVMVPNTGGDQKTWWWYTGATPAQVSSYATTNGARVTDLDYDAGSGTYSAIMEKCAHGCPDWWYWFGIGDAQLGTLLASNGARPIDIHRCGAGCFTAVALGATDAISARVGDLLRTGTAGSGATTGTYLKRVGGPILARLEPTYIYEPASAIKIGPAALAMRKVQTGTASLTDQIPRMLEGAVSCPTGDVSGTETLQNALQEMMWHSSNSRTLAIMDWEGGRAAVNTFLQAVGMTSTSINQVVGCGFPADTFTLADAGLLYEKLANGVVLDASHKASLFSMMAGKGEFAAEGYDFTGLWTTDFPAMVAQEAPPQMSAANKSWWATQADLAYKAGGYLFCKDGPCSDVIEHVDVAGWSSLPFCSNLTVVPHEYVFGTYITNAEDTSYFAGKKTAAEATLDATKSEVLREQIRASLKSCLHGDSNGDGTITVADVFWLVNALFAGGPAPVGRADANADGKADVADVFYVINYLFAGGAAPL